MTDQKLQFVTLAVRRALASGQFEASPVAAPSVVAYGAEDRAVTELQLALSELPDESVPTSVARLLLPEGVRLAQVEVQVGRTELPGRLGRTSPLTVTVALIPEPRKDGSIAGHWAFVAALKHACFVAAKEDLADRIRAELAVLPAALALDLDGWRRLLDWAPTTLEPVDVELATTPLSEVKGRKALADQERRRLAVTTLDAAGRRILPQEPAPPLVGRALLAADLARLLEGDRRRSVLLVGEEAAGKSALALAWATAHPTRMMWATSASELVAGASGLGEWQERLAAVLAAAETVDAILYFDDFGALFSDRPEAGGVDLASGIRRAVVDGRVRVIGELTPVALDRAERRDVSLIGAMLRVSVPATDPEVTTAVGRAWAAHWRLTQPDRPQISDATVPAAVELATRFLPYRAFPGKAVRLLEELRVAHEAGRDAAGTGKQLGPAELYAAFSWSSGIPVALLADDQALVQADVIAALRRRMIGQDVAVRRVAEAISVAKARLQPADKPLASLLFVGPTGTGKTELARSVAAYLFGAPDRMVRLDMSEYTDPWAAERLFGGDGDSEGRLTAAVRSQPFGVVLLDEIEKAHPSVWDLLLQVLGEARLTDGRGRTTYFHNAIIVLTSNLGTRSARGTLGLAPSSSSDDREERRYRDAVMAAFRPELINRLDQIVVFHPLTGSEIAKIADIAITRLADRRGFTQTGVLLDVSPAALAAIAERGFSPELGARALRRHVDAAVLGPAGRILARAGAEGRGGTLTVRASAEPPARRDAGAKIGEHVGALTLTLWRRGATTGRRMVRSALALGELRRATDRDLAHPLATAVRDSIKEIEATLATAVQKKDGRTSLPGKEIARLQQLHARRTQLWDAARAGRDELRVAEELCLEALARDIDAVDLIDGAVLTRRKFRRDLFWLMTSLRPTRPGATLLVHSPDARLATREYVKMIVAAAAAHGWPAFVHIYGENAPNWKFAWGPPHDRAWVEEQLTPSLAPTTLLVRILGQGADLLFGLEAGLHRFLGVAGAPAHVWVDLLEPRGDITNEEWPAMPGIPGARPPRGQVVREVNVASGLIEELDIVYGELPARLAEAAVDRLIAAHRVVNGLDALWRWERPLQAVEAMLAKKDDA